jgi:DNA-(apurinic or apyrimidinic site) lyase
MDVGVLTVALGEEPLDQTLEYLSGLGVGAVELGCGGFVGDSHLTREEYLDDEAAQRELLDLVDDHDLEISALSTHNNPLHPDEDRADRAATEIRAASDTHLMLSMTSSVVIQFDSVLLYTNLPLPQHAFRPHVPP